MNTSPLWGEQDPWNTLEAQLLPPVQLPGTKWAFCEGMFRGFPRQPFFFFCAINLESIIFAASDLNIFLYNRPFAGGRSHSPLHSKWHAFATRKTVFSSITWQTQQWMPCVGELCSGTNRHLKTMLVTSVLGKWHNSFLRGPAMKALHLYLFIMFKV